VNTVSDEFEDSYFNAAVYIASAYYPEVHLEERIKGVHKR